MPEYSNELSGALFKNNDKREGRKDPDYNGSCEIDGVEYWINSWINQSKAGVTYMSLKFKVKQAAEHRGAPANPPPPPPAPEWDGKKWVFPQTTAAPDFNDDIDNIPF
jgi:hypothetical protein